MPPRSFLDFPESKKLGHIVIIAVAPEPWFCASEPASHAAYLIVAHRWFAGGSSLPSCVLMSLKLLLIVVASAGAQPRKRRSSSVFIVAGIGGASAATDLSIIFSASPSASLKSVSFEPAHGAVAADAAV